MAFESYYYLFSLATFYIFVFHLWNTIFLKLKGRNLIGKVFKEGTSEHENIKKFTSKRAIGVLATALLLSMINLIFAIRELLRSFGEQNGVAVLAVLAFMVLVITVVIVLALRSLHGGSASRHSAVKYDDNKDEDW